MPLAIIPSTQTTDGFADTLAWVFTLGSSNVALPSGPDFTFDGFGCRWTGSATNTLGSKPAPKEVIGDRPYADGQWNGTQYIGAKSMPISGECVAPSPAALNAAEQRLKAAVSHLTFPLYVSHPGFEGVINVRQSGELAWSLVNPFTATFSIGLTADDPRIYSTQTRQFPLSFASGGSGPVWTDTTGPVWTDSAGPVWTDAGGSTSATLVNPGPLDVPLLLTITGPMTTVTVTVQTGSSAQALTLYNADAPGSPILTAGQTMVANGDTHDIAINGVSQYRNWYSGQWPLVPGNSTSTATLTGTGSGSVVGSFVAARY